LAYPHAPVIDQRAYVTVGKSLVEERGIYKIYNPQMSEATRPDCPSSLTDEAASNA